MAIRKSVWNVWSIITKCMEGKGQNFSPVQFSFSVLVEENVILWKLIDFVQNIAKWSRATSSFVEL